MNDGRLLIRQATCGSPVPSLETLKEKDEFVDFLLDDDDVSESESGDSFTKSQSEVKDLSKASPIKAPYDQVKKEIPDDAIKQDSPSIEDDSEEDFNCMKIIRESLSNSEAKSSFLQDLKSFDLKENGFVRKGDLDRILIKMGVAKEELKDPLLLDHINSCKASTIASSINYRKLIHRISVPGKNKKSVTPNQNQNSSKTTSKGGDSNTNLNAISKEEQMLEWKRDARLNVRAMEEDILRQFLVNDMTDSGKVTFQDFRRVFAIYICPKVPEKIINRFLAQYDIRKFNDNVDYRKFLTEVKMTKTEHSVAGDPTKGHGWDTAGIPEGDYQTALSNDVKCSKGKDLDRFMRIVEKIRDRMCPHFQDARQSLFLIDDTAVRTGIVLRTQLKSVIESFCGINITQQDWIRIMIKAKALAEKGRVYYGKVLLYIRAHGVPQIEDPFWVMRRNWESKRINRPLYMEWNEIMEIMRRNLQSTLNLVLEHLALLQKDGILYENVSKENLRKIVLKFGKVDLSNEEFEVVCKFGQTAKGTIDYMQLLRNFGVISSHDFGIGEVLKKEALIPEGMKQKDGFISRNGKLDPMDKLPLFVNPTYVRTRLLSMKGIGSIWLQFCDEDGTMRGKYFRKFLEECGIVLSMDCFNWLLQEMNKKFGDVIHLGDAIAFLHKRRPDKLCRAGTMGLSAVLQGVTGIPDPKELSMELLDAAKKEHGFQILSTEAERFQEWLENEKPKPVDTIQDLLDDAEGVKGPLIPMSTKKATDEMERQRGKEEERKKKMDRRETDQNSKKNLREKVISDAVATPDLTVAEMNAIMKVIRADVDKNLSQILERAEMLDKDKSGKLSLYRISATLAAHGIHLHEHEMLSLACFLLGRKQVLGNDHFDDTLGEHRCKFVNYTEDPVNYGAFLQMLARGPLSWAEDFEARRRRMQKDFDNRQMNHNWPTKPPSTDEAVTEYQGRVVEILKQRRKKATAAFSEKDHIELRNQLDAILEQMQTSSELVKAEKSLHSVRASMIQIGQGVAVSKKNVSEEKQREAEEKDLDLKFLENVLLRWTLLLLKLQDLKPGTSKFVSKHHFKDIFNHVGLKLKLPTLLKAYMQHLKIEVDGKIHYEWFLLLVLLLKQLRFHQILRAHVEGKTSNPRDELLCVNNLQPQNTEMDELFELALRTRYMLLNHLDGFWNILTTNDSRSDFLCLNDEFFIQLRNFGVHVKPSLIKFFLHFWDSDETGFLNYKDFVWNFLAIGTSFKEAAELTFPQKLGFGAKIGREMGQKDCEEEQEDEVVEEGLDKVDEEGEDEEKQGDEEEQPEKDE